MLFLTQNYFASLPPFTGSIVLALAGVCFLFVFLRTLAALKAGRYRRSLLNFGLMCAGFVFLTTYLYARGIEGGRCPTGTFPDMLVFMGWSIVLLYLGIGSIYRMSLMGAFTAPFVLLLQTVAIFLPRPEQTVIREGLRPIVQFHAAVSTISYGAFALACVAAVMFLIHERQIKRRTAHPLFTHLPPISDLTVAVRRLMVAGVVLLSIGIVSGFFAGFPAAKIAVGAGVWCLYIVILLAVHLRRLSARRIAALAILAFVLTLLSLLGMNFSGGAPL